MTRVHSSLKAAGRMPLLWMAALALSQPMVALTGCAAPGARFLRQADRELLWPGPPEPPRVRYIGSIAGSMRARPDDGLGAAFNRVLFGEGAVPSLVTPHAVAVHVDGDRLAIADPNARCVHLLRLGSGRYARIEWLDEGDHDRSPNEYRSEETQGLVKRTQRGATSSSGGTVTALEAPIGVAWADDRLLVADAARRAVYVVDPSASVRGKPWRVDRVVGADELLRPAGLAYDARRERIVVSDAGGHCVRVFDLDGRLDLTIGERGSGPGQLNYPAQVTIAEDGTIVVVDALNFRVQRFGVNGAFLGAFGRKGDAAGDFSLPKGIAVDDIGRLWVVDAQFENVQAFEPEGRLLLAIGGEGRGPGEFWLPAGAAIDRQRRLWVADAYNRRVQAFELLR